MITELLDFFAELQTNLSFSYLNKNSAGVKNIIVHYY